MVSVENGHFLYLETKVLWLGRGTMPLFMETTKM